MSAPAKCADCGSAWDVHTPDYGNGAEYAHYCSRTGSLRRHHISRGNAFWTVDLPAGHYERRAKELKDKS